MVNEGDVVRLKCGGPYMVVEEIDNKHQEATVIWFNVNHMIQKETFPLNTLVRDGN